MMLGFLIRLSLESWFGYRMKKYRTISVIGFAAGVLYACSDEIHQLAIDGRSGQWTDVFVDSLGVLAGITLGILVIKCLNRKKQDYSGGRHHGSEEYGILQEQ
jgi:VanZ family protein